MTNQRLSNLFSGLSLFMTRLYQQNSINSYGNHLRALVLRMKIHNDKCIENPDRWDLQMELKFVNLIPFHESNSQHKFEVGIQLLVIISNLLISITMLLKCIQNFHESLSFVVTHYKNHESVSTPQLVFSSFAIAPTFDCKARCKTVVLLLLIV